MTTAVDKWPTAAKLVAVAAAGHLPTVLHHLKGHDRGNSGIKMRTAADWQFCLKLSIYHPSCTH